MSRGISSFEPERLKQALAARRLSQVQLASMIGVSPSTVSKWRAGQQTPTAEVLERLANVINVGAEWFTRPPFLRGSTPLFRSNASAHVAARSMLEARLDWAREMSEKLEEFVDYPRLNLPERDFQNPEEITDQDIEEAAAECRDLWRLGRAPIPDLALAVEGAGVILVREETGVPQIEGLSAWNAVGDRPFILLAADKDNGFRSRFDLAHELGHLILHKHIPKATERERHKLMENQAHRFAGAFLLPQESFLGEIKTPVTLDSLLLSKQRWGVSVAAIIMRLVALDIVSDQEKIYLFKRRSARWGAKSEPYDNSRKPEQPRVLRRTIEMLVNEGIITLDSIPGHIGLSKSDIEMLAGLPEDYLEEGTSVFELATLRRPGTEKKATGGKSTTTPAKVLEFSSRSKC